jgi:hypothetical protein
MLRCKAYDVSRLATAMANDMRRIGLALVVAAFTGLLIYVSAARLLEWYQTGRLAVHKKHPLGGPDGVTYLSDPVGFTLQFDLYLFLLTMGVLGVLLACRDIVLEVVGPQSFPQGLLDMRRTYRLVMLGYWLIAGVLLIVAAVTRAI